MKTWTLRCGCSFMIVDGAPHIDLWNLPDCKMTWDFISSGKVKGGFQIETQLGREWCKKIAPRNLEELSAVIAIIRPGVSKAVLDEEKNITMAQKYLNVKNGIDEPFIIHECITPILKETHSISLYQEQSLQIAKVVAGFNLQEADKLRRAIGKKQADEMTEVRKLFIAGAIKVGKVTEEEANYIFDLIEKSERYSFNKCLTGDTILEDDYNNLTIESRYMIYHDPNYANRMGYLKVHDQWRQDGYFGYAYSLKPDGTFIKNIIRHIEYQGTRKVIEITLPHGLSIKGTPTHKFPTSDGVKKIKDICFSDKLFVKNQACDLLNILSIGALPNSQKVYDVEMDRAPHNFVANGIVTNNSHSFCYADTAYQTAWLKSHFTHEFFLKYMELAHLSSKPSEEIKDKIDDAKLFDIKTLPPVLEGLREHFHFVEGDNIRFGLTDIKGVGETQLRAMKQKFEEIEKKYGFKIEDLPWYQFLVLVSDQIVSSVMERFIRIGVLDLFEISRNRMEHEYKVWNSLTATVKKWIQENHSKFESLAEAIESAIPVKKNGGAAATEKISNSIKSLYKTLIEPPYSLVDTPGYVAKYEEEYLGAPITFLGVDGLDNEIVNTSCKEIESGESSPFMCVGAIVKRINENKIKNGKNAGKTMAHIDIMDETGTLESVVVWSDEWDQFEGLLKSGTAMVIQLERMKKDKTLFVKRVFNVN